MTEEKEEEEDDQTPVIAAIVGGCVAVGAVAGVAVALKLTVCAATATGAGAGGAGVATTGAAGATPAMIGAYAGATAAVVAGTVPVSLLVKHGLKSKALHETNLLSPETSASKMMSQEVLQVKDAPDMSLMETVRHFTFLLSEKNLNFVNRKECQTPENLELEIEQFSEDAFSLKQTDPAERSSDDTNASKPFSESSTRASNAAAAIFQQSSLRIADDENDVGNVDAISQNDRSIVIEKARRSLAWAHDPEREPVADAPEMTNDQVHMAVAICGVASVL